MKFAWPLSAGCPFRGPRRNRKFEIGGRVHLWVYLRCGPVTRSPSRGWLCQSASSVSFPPRMRPKLQGPDYYPGETYLPLNMSAFLGHTASSQSCPAVKSTTSQAVGKVGLL